MRKKLIPLCFGFAVSILFVAGSCSNSDSLATGTGSGTSSGTGTSTCTANCPPEGFVSIPAGWFRMGPLDVGETGFADELPAHFVNLDGYFMGKYEVTNSEYADALNWALENGRLENSGGSAYDGDDVYTSEENLMKISSQYCQIAFSGVSFWVIDREGHSMDDFPVIMVSWHGAAAYCNWRSEMEGFNPCYDLNAWALATPFNDGYRLPTEAEWERAAAWDPDRTDIALPDSNTGGHWIFCFSADSITPNRANCLFHDELLYSNPFELAERPYTSPVGYFNGTGDFPDSHSPSGCYDMSGNVWEWCNDCYADSYLPEDQTNPMGAESGDKVTRGGAWNYDSEFLCRGAARYFCMPSYQGNANGFRLARSPGQ